MPDEVGTEATRSEAPSADDSLFGEAPEDKAAATAESEAPNEEGSQDGQDSEDVENQDASTEELKVVLSIRGGRAIIGVQRPSADPHIETFDDGDITVLAHKVPAVTERASARWEETPKHPAYERPAPPARRRNQRQQRTAQEATAEADTEQAQQQTLRLF